MNTQDPGSLPTIANDTSTPNAKRKGGVGTQAQIEQMAPSGMSLVVWLSSLYIGPTRTTAQKKGAPLWSQL